MTDPRERMRALEKLREVENDISLRVHVLRRWVRADLARAWDEAGCDGAPPYFPYADRIEEWWRAPRGGEGEPHVDRETFDRIEVLAEWLENFDGAVADRVLAQQLTGVERYRPGTGDGTPLQPVLERIFLNLWTAQQLREEAGIESG